MDHSLTVHKTETGLEGWLLFGGDMTMVEAQETAQTLFAAILEVNTLNVDLQHVGAVDVSLIQLLCSAHRECFLSGKTIHIVSGANEAIRQLVERSGYCRQLGCLSGAREGCLWQTCKKDMR
jgi:ABC-type transporter Mla MlaB component